MLRHSEQKHGSKSTYTVKLHDFLLLGYCLFVAHLCIGLVLLLLLLLLYVCGLPPFCCIAHFAYTIYRDTYLFFPSFCSFFYITISIILRMIV